MSMMPRLRKFVLTTHITTSVGWLGAVTSFLGLTVAGLTSQNAQMVQAIYLTAEPITWFVLIPLAFASLLTGLILSLSTSWGLFQHYWVLFKLLLTVLATFVLLQYTQTVSYLADAAVKTNSADLDGLWGYLLHSSGALFVLLVATILSVYKPRGMTPYGWRKRQAQRTAHQPIDAAT